MIEFWGLLGQALLEPPFRKDLLQNIDNPNLLVSSMDNPQPAKLENFTKFVDSLGTRLSRFETYELARVISRQVSQKEMPNLKIPNGQSTRPEYYAFVGMLLIDKEIRDGLSDKTADYVFSTAARYGFNLTPEEVELVRSWLQDNKETLTRIHNFIWDLGEPCDEGRSYAPDYIPPSHGPRTKVNRMETT